MKLVLATTSAHKIHEIQALLSGVPGLQVLNLSGFAPIAEPEEDGASMAENARIKAQCYARHTRLPTLADDSGLEVDALDGEPGVRSARWAEGSDQDRTRALLARMGEVPDNNRAARYRCALCLVWPEEDEAASTCTELEATCEGRIGREEKGSNGFGYDPIFELTKATGTPPVFVGQTMAEVPPHIKAQVSHRAQATRALAERLRVTPASSRANPHA